MLYQLSYRGSASPRYSRILGRWKARFCRLSAAHGGAPSAHARSIEVPAPADAAEMSKADRFAIGAGTPGIALMERAGLAVAEEAARLTKSRGRIVIVCGPGGNGGDGFVAARLLERRGYAVELGLMGRRDALSGDPALAASRYAGPALGAAAVDPSGADCVIDALFGAGLCARYRGRSESDHRAHQRFRARRRTRGRGRRPVRRRRRERQGARRRGRGERQRDVLPPKPGHVLLPGRACAGRSGSPTSASPRPRSLRSRRKLSAMRPPYGARRCRTPTQKPTNTRAARPSFCPDRRTGPARPGSPRARPFARAPASSRWRARSTRSRSTPRIRPR